MAHRVPPDDPSAAGDSLRLDRFLVFARFFRTRGRAQALVSAGRVRINGKATGKTHALVRIGDVLTFPQGKRIRVVRILAMPQRRGSAAMAAATYEEVGSPLPASEPPIPGGHED